LNKLAKHIPTTDKKLSLLLNQYMNTTFYDFVNAYRVQSVKEKLASVDFDNLTLLGIAYESGFKSKTSFNRIFKKETGFSPSEYKKSLKNL
jgi:AraC-like DNA-binding protein